MSNLGFAILAALCGFVVVQGDPSITVNIDKFVVKNPDNPFFGKWTATVNPAEPQNKIDMEIQAKADIPEGMMVKIDLKSNGKQLPLIDVKLCKALQDDVIGKDFVACGKPFPKACQAKKGDYKIENWVVKNDKLPSGLPIGKLVGTAEIYMPGEKPVMVFEIEGEISRNAPPSG